MASAGWISWTGKIPLSQHVKFRGRLIPRYPWYMVSGLIGDICQFILYQIIKGQLGGVEGSGREHIVTISFVVAYLCCITIRQQTHKALVFGHWGKGSCWKNLLKIYASYLSVVAMLPFVNQILLRVFNALFLTFPALVLGPFFTGDIVAYFLTQVFSGILSFQLLKNTWKDKKTDLEEDCGKTESVDRKGGLQMV